MCAVTKLKICGSESGETKSVSSSSNAWVRGFGYLSWHTSEEVLPSASEMEAAADAAAEEAASPILPLSVA